MADADSDRIRVGDEERNSAIAALGEHMTAGRLDVDEYGERSARVTTARTAGELRAVFDDLPEPHPSVGTSAVQRHAGTARTPLALQALPYTIPLAFVAGLAVLAVFAPHFIPLLLIFGGPAAGGLTRFAFDHTRRDRKPPEASGAGDPGFPKTSE